MVFILTLAMIPLLAFAQPVATNSGTVAQSMVMHQSLQECVNNNLSKGLDIDASENYNYSTYVMENCTIFSGNQSVSQNFRQPYCSAFDKYNGIVYTVRFLSCEIMEVNTTTSKIIGTIPAYIDASSIVFCESNKNLYVSSLCGDSISVINTTTGKLAKRIPVGVDPCTMLLNQESKLIYVFNTRSYNISIINASKNAAQGQIETHETTTMGTVDNNGTCLVAVADRNQEFCLLNLTKDTEVMSFKTGEIKGITTDLRTGDVYISLLTGPQMYVITGRTHSISKYNVTISGQMLYCRENNLIYESDAISGTFATMNLTTFSLNASIQINGYPYSFSLVPCFGEIFVNNYISSSIVILNFSTLSLERTIPVTFSPSSMALCKDNGELYVSQQCNDTLLILNSMNYQKIGHVNLLGFQSFVSINPFTGELFALLSQLNEVAIISTKNNSLMYYISVGSDPLSVSFNPKNGESFVVNSISDTISVINPYSRNVSRTFNTGNTPTSSAFDIRTCSLYIGNSQGSNITVINMTSLKITNMLFYEASSLAINNDDSFLYVINHASYITVINLKNDQRTTFPVQGFPYRIFVDQFTGDIYYETFSHIALIFRNGSAIPDCFISIPSAGPMAFSRESSVILISDESGGVLHILRTRRMYTVNFREVGLSACTGWYVNITGHWISSQETLNHISIPLMNGTYSYQFQSSNRIYASYGHGKLIVNGSDVDVTVLFKKIYYDVTFTEEGLPKSTTWCTNISGIDHVISGNSLTVSLTNGSYEAIATSSSGSFHSIPVLFTVMGKNVNLKLRFSESQKSPLVDDWVFILTLLTISILGTGFYLAERRRT